MEKMTVYNSNFKKMDKKVHLGEMDFLSILIWFV